jgi:hypothetical protein
LSFKESFERASQVLPIKNQTDLAKWLGVTPSSITDAKRDRDEFSRTWDRHFAEAGINPTWIRTGQGSPHLDRSGADVSEEVQEEVGTAYDRSLHTRVWVLAPLGKETRETYLPGQVLGTVTNRTGLSVEAPHLIQYVMTPRVRPQLGEDGGLVVEGPGQVLADWEATSPETSFTLKAPWGAVVFDRSEVGKEIGRRYVVAGPGGYLLVRTLELTSQGILWRDGEGSSPDLPADGEHAPAIVGRVAWMVKRT